MEKSLLCLLSDDELEKEPSQRSNILDDDTLKHETLSSSYTSIECDEHESNVNLQLQSLNKKFKLETTGNTEKRTIRSRENKSSRGQFENQVQQSRKSPSHQRRTKIYKRFETIPDRDWTCIMRDPDLKAWFS